MSQPDDDAAWRSIVENYGERVQLDDPEPPAVVPEQPEPADVAHEQVDSEPEEHFTPPEPPPLPVPEPPRLLAWAGVLGVPVLAVVLAVVHVGVPSWLGVLGLAWFVGGFGYLVATMRRDEGPDDWDDGAVL